MKYQISKTAFAVAFEKAAKELTAKGIKQKEKAKAQRTLYKTYSDLRARKER